MGPQTEAGTFLALLSEADRLKLDAEQFKATSAGTKPR